MTYSLNPYSLNPYPMKIVVALDSFKGTLAASEACRTVAAVLRESHPKWKVVELPMADGGEGTASVLMAAAGGQWIHKTVMGPLPEMEVDAGFVWLPGPEDKEGISDCGFVLIDPHRRNFRQALTSLSRCSKITVTF